jgi:hypothetical protein
MNNNNQYELLVDEPNYSFDVSHESSTLKILLFPMGFLYLFLDRSRLNDSMRRAADFYIELGTLFLFCLSNYLEYFQIQKATKKKT